MAHYVTSNKQDVWNKKGAWHIRNALIKLKLGICGEFCKTKTDSICCKEGCINCNTSLSSEIKGMLFCVMQLLHHIFSVALFFKLVRASSYADLFFAFVERQVFTDLAGFAQSEKSGENLKFYGKSRKTGGIRELFLYSGKFYVFFTKSGNFYLS